MIKKFFSLAGQSIKKLARSATGKSKTAPKSPAQETIPAQEALQEKHQNRKEQKPQQTKFRQPPKKKKATVAWRIEEFEVTPLPDKTRFHDYELPLEIMHAIADLEFQYCTPIQEKAFPTVLKGQDMVGKAHTGTGKSAVFLITILTRLLQQKRSYSPSGTYKPRALVIAPTRELVIQIAKDGNKLATYTPLTITAVYGGVDYQKQINEVSQGKSDIIVATPGRLLDFIDKRLLKLDQCEIMVIDEADRMLDMGFIPDVRRIIGRVKKKEQRQTMLFSATITEEVKRLAFQWCRNPEMVDVETEQLSIKTVEQIVYLVTTEEKYTVLYNLLKKKANQRIMVFTNQKHEAKTLSAKLQANGINCTLLSGDVPQQKRTQRLEKFREGKVKVLIATDVAGRGIHIDGISHVVNFTLPYEPENYVHRIGRTGRAGAHGTSISFACEEGSFYLPEIEEYTGRTLECVVPDESLLAEVPPPRKRPNKNRRKKPPHSRHKQTHHKKTGSSA
ncbi:DEAD/DEAH box helicase [Desulfogranum marinum]|uniref:DEAD/DEAH box helicase n=1 Tax=Desulfogranum marinum TaxID=453220 RepID=UPI001965E15B|nr:DEAD/DEAH box helicase [Desulfogranum marinum]MBM9513336.1 DEAD/DEAH box helicase [Desulfogranum marinum]